MWFQLSQFFTFTSIRPKLVGDFVLAILTYEMFAKYSLLQVPETT